MQAWDFAPTFHRPGNLTFLHGNDKLISCFGTGCNSAEVIVGPLKITRRQPILKPENWSYSRSSVGGLLGSHDTCSGKKAYSTSTELHIQLLHLEMTWQVSFGFHVWSAEPSKVCSISAAQSSLVYDPPLEWVRGRSAPSLNSSW